MNDFLYCKTPPTENPSKCELFDIRSVPKSYYRPVRFEDLPFHLSQSYPPREIDILHTHSSIAAGFRDRSDHGALVGLDPEQRTATGGVGL